MTKAEALAADYWIENTQRIYDENLHVSGPVMDAYRAGYEAGLKAAQTSTASEGEDK